MKKSEKVLFAFYKTVYIITMIATAVTYILELVNPTTTYSSITASDWFTLCIMSCVFVFITETERKAKAAMIADNISI